MFKAPTGHECKLIAIEGADQLGKTTQTELLGEELCVRKWKATTEKVPYDDGLTKARIYEMLFDGTATQFPIVFQTLQGVNRRHFQLSYLPTLASHYDVIVLDRWSLSTRVYGTASGVPEETTNVILEGLVPPDLTLVLDGEAFPWEGHDAYEGDRTFQERVRRGYQEYCTRWPDSYVKIDANRSRQAVQDDLLFHALRVLR